MKDVVSVYIHCAEDCLNDVKCKMEWTGHDTSLNFHYRNEVLDEKINKTVIDQTMLKYKNDLVTAFELAWKNIGSLVKP